eukprot:s2199_g12.t1
MNALKTVAEAVISLLTMLLQFLIHQLEIQPDQPEGPESSPETMQTMEGMVLELQNQRAMLQSLMQSSSGAHRRPLRDSSGASTSVENSQVSPAPKTSPPRSTSGPADPSQIPVNSVRVNQVLQRQTHRPEVAASVTSSRVTNWQLLEESEEEVILDLEGRPIDLNPPPLMGTTGALGAMIPRASTQMTVGDWGQCRVTWGKKHKGQTYLQVLRTDPSYYQWAVARFQSLTPEMQDFVRFCQVQMDLDRGA